MCPRFAVGGDRTTPRTGPAHEPYPTFGPDPSSFRYLRRRHHRPMNCRRLLFLAVTEAGTVTAAATLHVAQPGLSRQLKTLEREVRMTLFEPRGNRLVLTPSGRAFAPPWPVAASRRRTRRRPRSTGSAPGASDSWRPRRRPPPSGSSWRRSSPRQARTIRR
ncbi:LysR family transcriptional regulator [Streptomyces sp. NPDC088249]|uniref:LysR family transcriptional regulator n=2 Tax=unclassified Streptomyces TaxID=2593676 RepID=UPI00382F1205